MEKTSTAITLFQFLNDCAEVAAKLDRVGSRDGRVMLLAALTMARTEYDSLLKRRDTLPPAVGHAPLIQIKLDNLLARLKFLEKRV
jgi:hypothetical protein